MMQLDEQIERAKEAAAQVGVQDAQRVLAESLPALEARQAALARRDAAQAQLDTIKAAVIARLSELRDKAKKQRAEIETTLDALHRLEKEIPSVAQEIRQEQKRLQNAVNELEAASRACGSSLGRNAVYNAWVEVGGHDLGLCSTAGIFPKDYFRRLADLWPTGFVWR